MMDHTLKQLHIRTVLLAYLRVIVQTIIIIIILVI